MKLKVTKSKNIGGTVRIPGSKSHTIRGLIMAGLATGKSVLEDPLISGDTNSCIDVIRAFGADVEISDKKMVVSGFGAKPMIPENVIDVGNSGTTMNIALGLAATIDGTTILTGDHQIRNRPIDNLIKSLNRLGATCYTSRKNGCPPVIVSGVITGGNTSLEAITSQYLTSLLIACPLGSNDSIIRVPVLNEAPYVEMTLWWMDKLGIKYKRSGLEAFEVFGNQRYKPFNTKIPGDFSSATFFAVLAAISGGEIILENLDITDPQGDKAILDILKSMGATVHIDANEIRVKGNGLTGIEIDMNAIPDALPAFAVAGCFAKGETRLVNVPQARLKETDRIRVMFQELRMMGADIEELPDGLIIRESKLRGCYVNGHHDHRIVMALAIAAMNIEGETIIDTAEAMNVTFPEFKNLAENVAGSEDIFEWL